MTTRTDPHTVLEAIDASWKHWDEDNVRGNPPFKIGAQDCPLCDLFKPDKKSCNGCPISTYTGANDCRKTPWMICATITDAMTGLPYTRDTTGVQEAFKAERDFIGEVRSWFIQIAHLW